MEPPVEGTTGRALLNAVTEGMEVVDRDGKRVGKVRDVYFGTDDDTAEARGRAEGVVADPTLPNAAPLGGLVEAFLPPDPVPDELRSRLLRDGYVQIDAAGLFASDRYATPEQLARVEGQRVVLNVSRDELVAR